jgi:signal transduction histidine kinase
MMERSLRTLLIEDSEDDAAMMLRSLKRAGFSVSYRRVESLEAMRSELEQNHWDLVLSDFNLPGFTAQSALKEVRERSLEIPFIIVSGAIGEELAAEMMRAGANDVINKSHLVRLIPAIERELREAEIRLEKKATDQERLKLVEDLKRAIEVRDEFLAIASHELKTPITSLRLQAQLLERTLEKKGPDEDYQKQVSRFASMSLRQLERLNRLVEDMLGMTRMMSQRLTIQRSEMDLQSSVKQVLDRFSEQIRQSGSQVTLSAGEGVSGCWDRGRIEQVIENILSNALKYGAGKPVEIEICRKGHVARLVIRDHGIGVAREDQQRIFSRFERAVSFVNISGLGLGLYIVSQIVQAHGGTVVVESEYGRGSAFIVDIPLQPGDCVDVSKCA